MKEFHKHTPNFKDYFLSKNFPKTRRSSKQESIKLTDQLQKKNLPELKLTKMKIRPGTEQELEIKEKSKISNKTGLKYFPFNANMNKNYKAIKKAELLFPKIRNAIKKANTNFYSWFSYARCKPTDRRWIVSQNPKALQIFYF